MTAPLPLLLAAGALAVLAVAELGTAWIAWTLLGPERVLLAASAWTLRGLAMGVAAVQVVRLRRWSGFVLGYLLLLSVAALPWTPLVLYTGDQTRRVRLAIAGLGLLMAGHLWVAVVLPLWRRWRAPGPAA